MKKLLVIFMAFLLVVGISGCNNKTAEEGNSDTVKFSYLRPVWGAATYSKGGAFEKELFKRANVEIDLQVVPISDYTAKANVIIGGGKLPDVIWGQPQYDPFFNDVIDQGAFLAIDEYLEKYPAIRDAIPEYLWTNLKYSDDKLYFIPNLIESKIPFMTFYRKDIFEKLEIPEPTTVEELEIALDKIKASGVTGENGKPIIPFVAPSSYHLKDFATSFDAKFGQWQEDKSDPSKIVPHYMSEQQIAFTFWLQDLSKKGVFDPEFGLGNDPGMVAGKFTSGNAAVLVENCSAYIEMLSTLKKNNPDADIGILPPLVGKDGTQGGYQPNWPMDRGFYIAKSAKDPDGIFRVLNWMVTEGHDFMQYGIEGKTYTVLDNGTKKLIPDDDRENDYKSAQIEPFRTLNSSEDVSFKWGLIEEVFTDSGFVSQFNDYKDKYEKYIATEFGFAKRKPFSIFETDKELAPRLYEDYMKKYWEGTVLDKSITKEQWMAALDLWLSSGGNEILDEYNSK